MPRKLAIATHRASSTIENIPVVENAFTVRDHPPIEGQPTISATRRDDFDALQRICGEVGEQIRTPLKDLVSGDLAVLHGNPDPIEKIAEEAAEEARRRGEDG